MSKYNKPNKARRDPKQPEKQLTCKVIKDTDLLGSATRKPTGLIIKVGTVVHILNFRKAPKFEFDGFLPVQLGMGQIASGWVNAADTDYTPQIPSVDEAEAVQEAAES